MLAGPSRARNALFCNVVDIRFIMRLSFRVRERGRERGYGRVHGGVRVSARSGRVCARAVHGFRIFPARGCAHFVSAGIAFRGVLCFFLQIFCTFFGLAGILSCVGQLARRRGQAQT